MSEREAIGGTEGARARAEAAREHVLRALRLVEGCESDGLDALQSALCAYVGALTAEDMPAESVTAEVRALVSAPATPQGEEGIPPTVREALMELALTWCAAELARSRDPARARGSAVAGLAPMPPAPENGPRPPA